MAHNISNKHNTPFAIKNISVETGGKEMEVADGSLLFLQKTNELSFSLLCLSLIEPKALHFVSFSSNSRQSHLTICAP